MLGKVYGKERFVARFLRIVHISRILEPIMRIRMALGRVDEEDQRVINRSIDVGLESFSCYKRKPWEYE